MTRTFLIMGLFSALTASGREFSERFEMARGIDGEFNIGEQGRVVVSDEVFGQARNFPGDIRIFGSEDSQWPFFLHVPKEAPEVRSLIPETRNRIWVDGAEPYLQFDLVVPQPDNHALVHNRLELSTAGRDFVRRVEIFSADSEAPNGKMAEGYLIEFSRERNARNQTIRYPDSDVARLRVRIYPNAQTASERVDLISVRFAYRSAAEAEREPVAFKQMEVPGGEKVDSATTWLLDVGQVNRPVEYITFKVGTPSYARSVSVFGRNSKHDSWRWVGGGEIHALKGNVENTVELKFKNRFLRLRIFHHDDQPLTVEEITLEAIPRYLVFEAGTEGPARLCFRAWDVKMPHYDLEGRIAKEAVANLPLFRTRPAVPNSKASTQPWRKYSKLLGIIAVGLVSMLVLRVISNMLRQQKENETQ